MVNATADRLEANYSSSQEEIQVRSVSAQPVNVYVRTFAQPIGVGPAIIPGDRQVLLHELWQGVATAYFQHIMESQTRRSTAVDKPDKEEPKSRMTEMNWLSSQAELRRKLAGQWIAIEGERLVAHGQKLTEVLERSRASGVHNPFVICLPEAHEEEIAVIA